MNERRILLFIFSVIIYIMYCVHMWFNKEVVKEKNNENQYTTQLGQQPDAVDILPNDTQVIKRVVKAKAIPLFLKNACSILEVFTVKPPTKCNECKDKDMDNNRNTISVIGVTVLLIVLALNAFLDILKVKEEEKARKKLNPDGERRQSLAEFANKKTLRRESSRFSFQLFQIAESVMSSKEEKKERRQTRPYTRGDSINSYLSERKSQMLDGSAPASVAETPTEPKLGKRQSVAKLFGARPAPMVRRSSFPALPLNPEVQALMLGHRQPSVDSDDEGDGRGRRVRLIRRY